MRLPSNFNISNPGAAIKAVRALPLILMFAALRTQAVGLPDTGQDQCDNGSNSMTTCSSANTSDAATYPRQDARYGRDAKARAGTLAKTGAGAAGFDYTKVANNGSDLAAGAVLGTGATDWACTRDNVTGLTWEMKTTNVNTLHDWGATFSWYSTDDTTNGNGGLPGPGTGTEVPENEGGDTCHSIGITCNTQAFVAAVNAVALCGFADWRLPTERELQTLVHAGAAPTIDQTYFPNVVPPILGGIYWSAATYLRPPNNLTYAWGVDFETGKTNISQKKIDHLVRLVRGTPF